MVQKVPEMTMLEMAECFSLTSAVQLAGGK